MSLKEDMALLGRHISNGTAKQFMRGECFAANGEPLLPPEPMPKDPSIGQGMPLYAWITARGD